MTTPVLPVTPVPTVVGVEPPTAETVYSPENIEQAATQPVAQPDLQDPYGLREQFLGSPEIAKARAEVLSTQGMISGSKQALRGTTRALEGQNIGALGRTGASVNLIGRQVGRARQLTADELAGLGETLQGQQALLGTLTEDAEAKYNIALRERENLQDLIRQTGGQANITYGDSYEDALRKAKGWEKKEIRREEKRAEKRAKESRKQAEKDELKAELRAIGKGTKGSRRELERRLKKYIKKDEAYAQKIRDLEYKTKLKAYQKPYAPKKGEKVTPLDFSDKGLSGIIDEEFNVGTDWQQIAEKLEAVQPGITKSGGLADKYLRYKFGEAVNPFE